MQLTREWFYANMVSVHFRNIAKPFLRAQPITTMTVQYHFFNYVRRYIVVGNSWLTEHNKIDRSSCAHLWRGSPPPQVRCSLAASVQPNFGPIWIANDYVAKIRY